MYCVKHDTYYANTPECPRCATPDGIDALEAQVAALTAENERLREQLVREAGEHMRGSGLLTAMNDDLRADNARLVESLEAEGARYEQWKREAERLRSNLSALRAAALAIIEADHYQEDDNGVEYGSPELAALRVAVAALDAAEKGG